MSVPATYHTVRIQNLPPVKAGYQYSVTAPQETWKRKKCNHYQACNCNVLHYSENCTANTYSHSNSFYGAFVQAYNNHEDLILSPDDVWMIVCLHFSKYINENAEKMRHLFVSHQGQKSLTVTTHNQLDESEWDEFFTLIIQAIKTNTLDNVTDKLKCDFSTTTPFETMMSTVAIMDSFKKYFSYGRCIPCCGINQVKFMGTLADWEKVRSKVQALKAYAGCKGWEKYVDELVPILDQFVNTYNGKVDVDFWNKVMNITHGRIGSGSTSYVSGWILSFFGIYNKVDTGDIPSYSFEVPINIDNKLTGQKKTVQLIGGFGGVHKEDGAYRPQLSMIVYHDGTVQ
jgi:hypothetical protein